MRYILTSNTVVAYTMINEEEKAKKLTKDLDLMMPMILNQNLDKRSSQQFNDVRGITRSMTSNTFPHQDLMQAVSYFNKAVLYLRSIKLDSILNQQYGEIDIDDSNQYSLCQNLFSKVIKCLSNRINLRQSTQSQKMRRYNSGDFRSSTQGAKSPDIEYYIETVLGYAHCFLGVLSINTKIMESKSHLDTSYQLLYNLKNDKIMDYVRKQRHYTKYIKEEIECKSVEHTDMMFNTMFCITDSFSVFITNLYEIDLPQFTYYKSPQRTPQGTMIASRSTSQNIRLPESIESSPLLSFNQPITPVVEKSEEMHDFTNVKKMPYKYYRTLKHPYRSKDNTRSMKKMPKKKIVVLKKKKTTISGTMNRGRQTTTPKFEKILPDSSELDNLNSGSSILVPLGEQESIFTQKRLEFDQVSVENDTKAKQMNSSNSVSQSEQEQKHVHEQDQKQENEPIANNTEINQPESIQESETQNLADNDEEQKEKAIVIQRMYRQKLEKMKTLKQNCEEDQKARIIQRKYKEKLERRKLEQEKEELQKQKEKQEQVILTQKRYHEKIEERKRQEKQEENEKASMIQKMYRAKKTKQSLLEEKHRKEENEKAIVIQRIYRDKKKNQTIVKETPKEVEGMLIDSEMQNKAELIQKHYRGKRAKRKDKKPTISKASIIRKITEQVQEEDYSSGENIEKHQEEKQEDQEKVIHESFISDRMDPKLRENEVKLDNRVPSLNLDLIHSHDDLELV